MPTSGSTHPCSVLSFAFMVLIAAGSACISTGTDNQTTDVLPAHGGQVTVAGGIPSTGGMPSKGGFPSLGGIPSIGGIPMGGGGSGSGSGGTQAVDTVATAFPMRTDCAPIVETLAKQTQIAGGTCTAVVRLNTFYKIVAHTFICGKYARADEATARAIANKDVAYSGNPPGYAGDGKLISSTNPVDEWVFESPALDFGGITAVSVRSGLTVFAGATVWQAEGQAVYPKTWKTDDLGLGCGQAGGQAYTPQVAGLPITGSPTAAAVVLATAIPKAFAQWGGLFEVLVLGWDKEEATYIPPNPPQFEFVVLLNAGWLE